MLSKQAESTLPQDGELYAVADPALEAFFDRVVRIARNTFEVPAVVLSVLDGAGHHRARKAIGLRRGHLLPGFSVYVCETGTLQVIEDRQTVADFADDPFFRDHPELSFAAGAPLVGAAGRVWGALCLFDVAGKPWTGTQQTLLADLAHLIAEQMTARRPLRTPEQTDLTLLTQALRGIDACLFVANMEGVIQEVNASMCEVYGYAPEALVGQSFACFEAPENPPELSRVILEQAAGNGWQGELLHRREDGTVFPALLSLTVVRGEQGRPLALIGMVADVSERRARELTLRRYNERLQALAKINARILQAQSPQGVAQTALQCLRDLVPYVRASIVEYDFRAREGLILAIDVPGESFEGMGGYLIPPTDFEHLGTLDPDRIRYVENVAKAGTPEENRLADIGIQSFLNVPLVAEGSLMGTLNVGADYVAAFTPEHRSIATEVASLVALRIQQERLDWRRRQAEAENRELKTFYEKVLHELPIPVEVLDPGGRYLYLNPAAVPDTEMRDWLQGKTAIDFSDVYGLDEVTYQQRHRWVEQVVARREESQIEESIRMEAGGERHLLRVAAPVLDADGAVTHVVGYSLDLTEAKQYERELIEAKEHAEEIVDLKEALLANMSHEIRTPLASIIGFADVLAEDARAENREFARLIRRSGQRLMETLNAVLDLARIESGSMTLSPEPCVLAEVAQEVIELVRPTALERGLWLSLRAPTLRDLTVSVDYLALQRVLFHLVNNALKFTYVGGVTLTLGVTETHAEVHIEDTGVGISKDFMPRLFETFTQESTGIDRTFDGIGIGLAISQRLVEMMGGEIEVKTTRGRGSVFTARLPYTPPTDDAALKNA